MTKRDAELLERITTVSGLMGGKATVRGLRITVEQITFGASARRL